MFQNQQTQGTVQLLSHTSSVLQDNPAGDPAEREIYVYLPPGYADDEGKTFPVIYCLTGFTGRGKMFLNDSAFSPNLPERIDKLLAAGRVEPFICVMPDCFTKFGGSQYINSTATGRYEDYLTEEIVPFVDDNFRTIRDRGSRAVAGKSSGGYAALIYAMRHADIFGLTASISGDCYFEMCYKPDFMKAFRAIKGDPRVLLEKFWNEEAPKSKSDFDGLNIIGMSACYSPNPASPWGFDLPFDLTTGEIREEVWSRWLEHDPVELAAEHTESLNSLKLLFIDAGKQDEFALDVGARVLSRKLKDLGVRHIPEEFDGGHFNINYRYNRAFEVICQYFG